MTNKKCVVPERTLKMTKPGYEEIHVPAPAPRPFDSDEKLVPIRSLPDWAQPGFSGLESLNRVQSRIYPKAMFSDDNLLLCAPTGAGKTNVAVLTMLREIGKYQTAVGGSFDLTAFKIVYIAPMKALVQEMVSGFGRRLAPFGIKVSELTGDQQLTNAQISETQVIVTTPEKWDVITRKGGDQSYTRLVRLIIIDEIHLLHDNRGPVLEALVARILRQVEETQEWVRLIGLSATLPNYVDVARFLRVDPKSGIFFFDASYRPCPLAQQFIGVTEKNAVKRQNIMNDIAYEKCRERAGESQCIVFVHSRKDAAKTAKYIRDLAIRQQTIAAFLRASSSSKDILAARAESAKSNDLKDLLPYGFAIHHAGMSRPDRSMVEGLFAEGHIQVLVSTATLAWGVNLPAHTVIIKGTQVYNPEKGCWSELSAQDTLQMLGRAGRPQYDVQGEGIVITGHSELQFYLSLLNQQLPIESQLVSKLLEHLNAEIVLGSIRSLVEAIEWLGFSYLNVRMAREPALYGVPQGRNLKSYCGDLCHSALLSLDKASLIRYDRRTGHIQPTELGRIAAHYYVGTVSMVVYNEHLRPFMDDIDLFHVFSLSQEFRLIPVRREEKVELAKLSERIPIPLKEGHDQPSSKINILLQAYISQLSLEGFALASDMVYVTQSAGRILRAIFEMCLRRGWSKLAKKALTICKMVEQRQWLSMTPLRQIRNGLISNDVLRKLEHKDFPFSRLADLSPQELGELIRMPKLGKDLYSQVHSFPKLDLQASAVPLSRELLRVDLTITPSFTWDSNVHGISQTFWLIVEDVDEDHVLHAELFVLRQDSSEDQRNLALTIQLLDPLPPAYFVSLISDRWLQCEARLPLMLQNMLLPNKPADISETENDAKIHPIDVYPPELAHKYENDFNSIESTIFPALYRSDENVLLAAPVNSCQAVCVEMALARAIAKGNGQKIVVLCSNDKQLEVTYQRLSFVFGDLLSSSMKISRLTGDSTVDLKLLESSLIIIANARHWDQLSRRWKTRKAVQAVGLFVVNDIHLIGYGSSGALLETVVSRMRLISLHLERSQGRLLRFVALGTTMANIKDIGAWLGISPSCLFNFDLDSRPVRLSIHIQGFNIANQENSLLSMTRPAYRALKDEPSLVFVSDDRQAKITAANFLTMSNAEAVKNAVQNNSEVRPLWPHLSEQEISSLEGIDSLQRQLLGSGIAYLASSSKCNGSLMTLFQENRLQLLVISKAILDSIVVNAPLVIILGTQAYSGQVSVDYPIIDVLKMIGSAGRVGTDSACRVFICCPSHRKSFLKAALTGPLPVESHLDSYFVDHLNAEVVSKTIDSKQQAVDYLTWTYLYRRLSQNPSYYGLPNRSALSLSEHLSQVVEQSIEELSASKCIEVAEDGMTFSALNLGMISAYYNISHLTVEMFALSLTANTRLRGILEIIAAANEFDDLPIRPNDIDILRKLYDRCPIKQNVDSSPKWLDPHVKTLILLQSYFSRISLPSHLELEQNQVVSLSSALIQAMVDVISSHGWLNTALAAMEFSQMLVQAQWDHESPLKQLPYFSSTLLAACNSFGVESIFDLIDNNEKRDKILSGLDGPMKSSVIDVLKKYPNMQADVHLGSGEVSANAEVVMHWAISRENSSTIEVSAPYFPRCKEEGWWLVVGIPSEKVLLGIKRFQPKSHLLSFAIQQQFIAPSIAGSHSVKAFLVSDCWLGCDMEFDLPLYAL